MEIDLPPPVLPSNTTPIIQNVALDFDEQGAFVRVTGLNLGNTPEDLKINWEFGSQTDEQSISPGALSGVVSQKRVEDRESFLNPCFLLGNSKKLRYQLY